VQSGIFQERNSLLHRLNPLTKVMATAPLLLFLSTVTDPVTPAVFIAFTIVTLLLLGNVDVALLARIVLLFAVLALSYVVIYSIFSGRTEVVGAKPIFSLGVVAVSRAGFESGVATGLRIFSLGMVSLLFGATTSPSDLIRALMQQWKLSYRLGYGVLAAYRFVPMLDSEFETIRAAHRVRGVHYSHHPVDQYLRLKKYSIPLLASAIRKAERVAIAMDSKAFGAFPTRTYYRRTYFQRTDWIFLASFLLISGALVALIWHFGYLRSLTLAQ